MGMRNIFILTLTGLALCGCATDPSVYRQASLNCQAVGISESDPQFATCAAVYSRRHLEDRLTARYHDALATVPFDAERHLPHNDGY
ncbi:MAG TPA: hypothetical protein VEU95_09705 [Micropepsaceae bacterium]|nr:hypothetical protein [Micropepsaceae bacterium]